MSASLIPAEPESLAALREQDARHLRLLLIEMAEGGAALAKLYVQQAQDQAADAGSGAGPSPASATAYCAVSRSVRRSVMLIQKLTEPAPVPQASQPVDRVAARKQLIRQVEDSLYRDAPEDEADSLHAEFLERLEGAEFDESFGQRSVQEIVNEIRADLAIHGPDSLDYAPRRTPADIAVLCARAGVPAAAGSAGLAHAASARAFSGSTALRDDPLIRGP